MQTTFEFRGSGFGYIWLLLWTAIVSVLTFGLFFPWAYSAQLRWINANTYIGGRQLAFVGSGLGLIWHWLVMLVLLFITFGLYTPWAYCRLKRWETDNTVFDDECGVTDADNKWANRPVVR